MREWLVLQHIALIDEAIPLFAQSSVPGLGLPYCSLSFSTGSHHKSPAVVHLFTIAGNQQN